MLAARALTKRFRGAQPIFQPQTLDVAASAVAFVHGGPGAGKSTLLRMLAGLEPPTSGTVQWDGEDLFAARRALRERHNREVSVIFPDHALLPSRTLLENLVVSQRLVGLPKQDAVQASYAMLQRLDLSALADTYPRALSGSQERVACVARAVLRRPRLIVADEPDAGLEADAVAAVRELLVEATVQGAALVVSQQQGKFATLTPSVDVRLESVQAPC